MHLLITDTLKITHKIDSVVFDTLYNFIDSVVVREIKTKAEQSITTSFKFDTIISRKDLMMLISVKCNNDGVFELKVDETRLTDSVVVREKVNEIKGIETTAFDWLVENKLVLILIIIFLILLTALIIIWKLK
jgi:hypothetical protein